MHTLRKEARGTAAAKLKGMVGKAAGGAVSFDQPHVPSRPRNRPDQADHAIDGVKASKRLDRAAFANGGRVKKGATNVNVIVAPAAPPPPAAPPMAMAPPPAPTPPPQPSPLAMGAPPPQMGGMGGMPGAMGGIPGMKRGGRAGYKRGGKVKMDAGAGSGEGRLEKIELQEKAGR